MPALSPSACGERLPEHDADVLDGVVRVDLEVAFGLHRQVEQAVAAERVEHVVEERHAGRDSVAPVPSRSSATVMSVSRVARSTAGRCVPSSARPFSLVRYVVAARPGLLAEVRRRPRLRRGTRPSPSRKRSFSSSVPTVTRRQSSSPGEREKSRTSTEWPCSRSRQSAGRAHAEQHEVRLGGEDLDAVEHREPVQELVAAAHDVADAAARRPCARGRPSRRPTARTRRPSTAGAPS